MKNLKWRKQINGGFVARKARFNLRVRPHASTSFVRYVIRTRQAPAATSIIASGLAIDSLEGMHAAERALEQFMHADAPPAKLQVMIVDDDAAVRDGIVGVLQDEGYRVTETACAEGALRRLDRSDAPAVLITEIHLKAGMSGLELLAVVGQSLPDVGVLLISGETSAAANDTGEAFLAKPFSTEELLDQVAAITARKMAPSAAAVMPDGAWGPKLGPRRRMMAAGTVRKAPPAA